MCIAHAPAYARTHARTQACSAGLRSMRMHARGHRRRQSGKSLEDREREGWECGHIGVTLGTVADNRKLELKGRALMMICECEKVSE